jgi:hypothetical protein
MAKKLGDLAVRIGTYQKDGQDRGRYVTLGTFFQGDDGSYFGSIDTYYDLQKLHDLQRRDDHKRGREVRDNLNVTLFSDDARPGSKPASGPDFDANEPF